MERSGVLPHTQFVYRKGLGNCDTLLRVPHMHCDTLLREPLIRSTIREFCISSVLWVLKVLCCLY